MKMLPLHLFLLLLLAAATAAHTISRREAAFGVIRACVATCTSGLTKGKRFLKEDSCMTASDNCGMQFSNTAAGSQVQSACGTNYTIDEFSFADLEVCEKFTNNVMAPVIQQVGNATKPQYADDKSVQTEAGCGCKDLVGQFLGTIEGSTTVTAGSFCSYLEGRVKAATTKSVCIGSKPIPIFGSLCDMVVGKAADVVGEALGPAFDSFCGQIVKIAKSDFALDLDESFVAAKNYTDKLTARVCGSYLCPGPSEGVCELVADVKDVAVTLASAVCQATGAGSSGGSGGRLCFPADALVIPIFSLYMTKALI